MPKVWRSHCLVHSRSRGDEMNIPPLYAQEEVKDPIVYLIITCMNSRWLITEYDPEQNLGFGWCEVIPGCGELGYVSFDELASLPYIVEYKPTQTPLSKLKA